MRKKRELALFLLVLFCATNGFFGNFTSYGRGGEEDIFPFLETKKKLLIIFMKFEDLMCDACSLSFLDFSSALPPHVQREKMWLIVTVNSGSGTEREKKISVKKIEGFVKGNSLHLPVSIDFSRIFAPLLSKGARILLIGGGDSKIRSFPLNSEKDVIADILISLRR